MKLAGYVGPFFLLLSACNFRAEKSEAPTASPAVEANAAVIASFTQLKEQFLNAKCIVCHNSSSTLDDLSSYEHFHSVVSEIRARVVSNGPDHMPKASKPQLTPSELNLLLAWIDAGAPEDGAQAPVEATPTPPPTDVAGYDQLRDLVLKDKCITCHVGTNPVGDSDDFSGYPGTFAFKGSIKKRVLMSIDSPQHMPPADRPQLTSDELNAIVKWVEAGGPK